MTAEIERTQNEKCFICTYILCDSEVFGFAYDTGSRYEEEQCFAIIVAFKLKYIC